MKVRLTERIVFTKHQQQLLLALSILLLVVIPVLNTVPAESSSLYVPDYMIKLLGKFLCYAMVALAIDLLWGYTGILSLGHGVFFALGGYVMGMYLTHNIAGEGMYRSKLPDFMVFLGWKEMPWFWYGLENPWFCGVMIIVLPALVAFAFGYFAFRSSVKDVYLSIITQAATYALMLVFLRNEAGLGGENGLTDFKRILGFSLQESSTSLVLYLVTGVALLSSFLLCRFIVCSRLGLVLLGVRDAETRLHFAGYSSFHFKLFVWTLSAVLCGIAGALYVPQVGIINPGEMHPAKSIEIVIWVAVGGRGTLAGAVIGSGVVNGLKSWFTVVYPDLWLIVLGILFVAVTMLVPEGIVGLGRKMPNWLRSLWMTLQGVSLPRFRKSD